MSINFKEMSDDRIIDLVGQGIGSSNNTAALLEMQRRATEVQKELIEAVNDLDQNMRTSSKQLVETESRQTVQTETLVTLAEETSKQTDKLIVLTKWIIALTIILGALAGAQLWAMLVKGA
jgi:hypothetical protein